jgi:hypothetical protein
LCRRDARNHRLPSRPGATDPARLADFQGSGLTPTEVGACRTPGTATSFPHGGRWRQSTIGWLPAFRGLLAERGAGAVILAVPARLARARAVFQGGVIANWQSGVISILRLHHRAAKWTLWTPLVTKKVPAQRFRSCGHYLQWVIAAIALKPSDHCSGHLKTRASRRFG